MSQTETPAMKKRRKHDVSSIAPDVEEEQERRLQKKLRACQTWNNLDLVLSLQSKDHSLSRKIEFAFDFVRPKGGVGEEKQCEHLPTKRTMGFLGDWIQHCMISSDKSEKESEICKDIRCWTVLRCSLEASSFRISANFLRLIGSALKGAILWLESADFACKDGFLQLYDVVFECLSLLFSSHGRTVNNAGVEQWVSSAVSAVGLLSRCLSGGVLEGLGSDVFARLSSLVLEQFSAFSRSHPSPRNVFRAFADRLLEPLLEVVAILHERMDGGGHELESKLLETVGVVLSCGLFHPSHMSGFLALKSLNMRVEEDAKGFHGSYHRHLFQKIKKIVLEKKGIVMSSFGFLFGCFVIKAKKLRDDRSSSKVLKFVEKEFHASEMTQEINQPLFRVFLQLMDPLLLECKKFVGMDHFNGGGVDYLELSQVLCVVKSINTMLEKLMLEKIYSCITDSLEGESYNFLKEVHGMIISIWKRFHLLWSSNMHLVECGKENVEVLRSLGTELVVAIGHVLEIEYRIIGDDLTAAWLIMLSNLFLSTYLTGSEENLSLKSKVLHVGCQLINLYSELRQVDRPIFALCKAVRFLFSGANGEGDFVFFICGGPLSSKSCTEAVATLLLSQQLQIVTSNAIKFIPEGQASSLIEQLNEDVACSLTWARNSILTSEIFSIGQSSLDDGEQDLNMQLELLGMLSEMYATMLDSLPVKSSSSGPVRCAVENVLGTIRPFLAGLISNHGEIVDDLFYLAAGIKSMKQGLDKLQATTISAKSYSSWLLVFLFRMYVSCRILYHQLVLVLPKNAEKAANTMGSAFLIAHGESWIKTDFTGNYFTWIIEPSIPLPAVIECVLTIFPRSDISSHAPLVYVLLTMALQRLSDLNRQIKCLEYLKERLSRSSHFNFVPDNKLLLDLGGDELKQKIDFSKEEAVELTSFITQYLPPIASSGEAVSSRITASMNDDASFMALSVCSLNEKTLTIAIWKLLCRNIQIWSPHATTKITNKFLSAVIYLSLPMKVNPANIGSKEKKETSLQHITTRYIFSELLVLDQMALSRHFASRLLRSLKKTLSSLISYACAGNKDLGILSDWPDALSALEEMSFICRDIRHASTLNASPTRLQKLQGALSHHEDGGSIPFERELRTCQSLMNLLCLVVKVHLTARSVKHTVKHVYNLERFLLLILLRHKDEYLVFQHFELLKLFVSCRRVLRYLGEASFDGNMAGNKSSFEMALCENPLSISWLLKSASEIVALPYCFFGTENCHETRRFFFSLMDHTSYLFFVLIKRLLFTSLVSSTNDDMTCQEPSMSGKAEEHTRSELPSSCSAPTNNAWQKLQLVAENLKKCAEDLLKCCKYSVAGLSSEFDGASADCNKLLCIVSCIQGFLHALSTTLSAKDMDAFKARIMKFMLCHGSEVYRHINLFGGFVVTCLTTLVVDGRSSDFSCLEHSLSNKGAIIAACSLGNDGNEGNSYKQLDLLKDYIIDGPEEYANHDEENSTVDKTRVPDTPPLLDPLRLENLKRDLLQRLLKGESSEIAFLTRQLFLSTAALTNLYSTHLSIALRMQTNHMPLHLTNMLVGTSYHILSELAEMSEIPDPFCYTWLDGPIKYMEVLGRHFYFSDSDLSKNVYSNLIDVHIRAIGKCISLLGKTAVLASHDIGANAKMHHFRSESGEGEVLHLDPDGRCLIVLKARLGSSFIKFVRTPVKLHFLSAVQALERALIGVQHGLHMIYKVDTGDLDGGRVSAVVAAGIDCFDLILESVSGNWSSSIIKKHMKVLVGSLFNVIAHLQSPIVFYQEDMHANMRESLPDPGAVILMCIEVLTKVAGKSSAYQMDPSHVGQSLNLPMLVFQCFHKHTTSHVQNYDHKLCPVAIDHHFSMELYAACCRLLCATLRHRKRETVNCICLLQGSVEVLLANLETDVEVSNGKVWLAWTRQQAVKCASFLRRVYEEIRQQKDLLQSYAAHFLSNYIRISSGLGPLKSGMEREVDEALRPGIYAVVDICSPDDLQLLHTVLGEASCRTNLANLQRDYKLNFQYEGKI